MTRTRVRSRTRAPVDPFTAVADPTRRALLDRLREGDAPVATLAAGFKISRPAVSQHLRVLRDARLVRERSGADGRQRIYQLTAAPLQDVADWAERYGAFWEANLESFKRHVESASPKSGTRTSKPANRAV